MKKLKIFSLLLITTSTVLFATGLPVFDAQGLVYSILSYSEEATQVTNFIKNMEREVRQYEQLYRKISEGDVLGAINNIQGSINRLEKNLNKYAELDSISSQVFDISQSANDWLNHSDDPDYFVEMLMEIGELESTTNALMHTHKEDIRESKEESANKANDKSSQVQNISLSDSEAEKSAATYNETVDGNISQAEDASNSFISDVGESVQSNIASTKRQLTGLHLQAVQNKAEEEAINELQSNLPDLSVDMRPSYGD